jgi:hypothetical protein
MAEYAKTSPWYNTPMNDLYLETMVYRILQKKASDATYVIENQYKHRPDLLANDLYGTPKLWWVFVARNRDLLKDPVFDFLPGVTIYCPRKKELLDSINR